MKEKIKELAQKYKIPEGLMEEAIQMERDKIVYKNRQLVPKLIELIEKYSEKSI